jgi:hypothetical protein
VSTPLSSMNLDDDLAGAKRTERASRWQLSKPGPTEIWAILSPLKQPGEKFTARLIWTEYPSQPPSVRFIDPQSGRHDVVTAWPVVQNVRLGPQWDICQSTTAEGFTAHPEWRSDPKARWDPRGNVLLKTLTWLQELLDETFQRRAS